MVYYIYTQTKLNRSKVKIGVKPVQFIVFEDHPPIFQEYF